MTDRNTYAFPGASDRAGRQKEFQSPQHTIANLGCSVLHHFGLRPPNPTLPEADRWLRLGARNVVVLLLDGMGFHNMRELLPEDGFFFRHLRHVYSSVFPPTTAAAVTSLDSGLFPAQHGWLGWTMYYPQLDKNVGVFTNQDDDGNPAADFMASQRFMPYASITGQIRDAGFEAIRLSPFEEEPAPDIQAIGQRLISLCAAPGRKYIYAYCPQPDSDMHRLGSSHMEVRAVMGELEQAAEGFSQQLKDALLIITADHGQVDARGETVEDHPQLLSCLARLPSIEPRTLNLFVKPGADQAFREAFAEALGEDYCLYAREQALAQQLFGPPPFAPGLEDTLGDYIAVAMTQRTLFNNPNQLAALKGVHAGGMRAERRIPLIVLPPQS